MMMKTVKRLAAEMMGVGIRRVRVDPARAKEAEKALTRYDVKNLIKSKVLTKAPIKGRRKNIKKKRKGHGSRKGALKARRGDKELWMRKVRSQRSLLRQMVEDGALEPQHKRKIYMRIKSGLFRSKRALLTYLKEAGQLKPDYEPEKKQKKKKSPASGKLETGSPKPETEIPKGDKS